MVEGNKIITELADSPYIIREIFTVNPELFASSAIPVHTISDKELKRISFLQHPKDSVAVCELMENSLNEEQNVQLILDGIQDPGNLGTIIRLADWFGIEQIICSHDTTDIYNPKVIQASMGSFTRVKVFYTDLDQFLQSTKNINIGTDMSGENIYEFKRKENMNIILGNEGNGLRENTEKILHHKITIPRFGKKQATESLNVGVAAGIILGQLFSK